MKPILITVLDEENRLNIDTYVIMLHFRTKGNLYKQSRRTEPTTPACVLWDKKLQTNNESIYLKQVPVFFSPEQHFLTSLTLVYLPSGEWNNLHASVPSPSSNKIRISTRTATTKHRPPSLYLFLCSSVNLLTSWEEDVDVLVIQTEQCTVCSHPMTILSSVGRREGKCPVNKHMVIFALQDQW